MLRSQHNAARKEDKKISELEGDEEKEGHKMSMAEVPNNSLSHFLYASQLNKTEA